MVSLFSRMLVFPVPITTMISGTCWQRANNLQWRLFFAGLYPVEFRDFFLGDMYCSLTYAMSVSILWSMSQLPD